MVTSHDAVLRAQGVDDGWHGEAVSEWANMLASQLAVGMGEALGSDVRVGIPSAVDDAALPDRFGVVLRGGATEVEVDVHFDDGAGGATPR